MNKVNTGNDKVFNNVVSAGFLLTGLHNYSEDGGSATSMADCLIADQYAKDSLLSIWGSYLKDAPDWFETVVCVMYSNVLSLDDETMRKSLSARIRTRLAAVYAKAGLSRRTISKVKKGGYNGYEFKLATSRKSTKSKGKFTSGDRTTAKRIGKYETDTKLEVLAAFLEVAGISSDDLDDLADVMLAIESAADSEK